MYWILTSKTGGQLYIDTSLSRLGSYWPCKVSQIASYLVLVFSSFLSRQHWHEVKEKGPSQNVYVKKNLLPTVSWGNVKFPLFGCPCFTLFPVQSNWDYVMCPFLSWKFNLKLFCNEVCNSCTSFMFIFVLSQFSDKYSTNFDCKSMDSNPGPQDSLSYGVCSDVSTLNDVSDNNWRRRMSTMIVFGQHNTDFIQAQPFNTPPVWYFS